MTLSTEPSRSRRSSGGGSSNGTWAAAIVFFARVIRACTVAVGTRNARAISSLVRPPSTRRVSATRASRDSTGWQEMNISASTSSSIWSGSHSSVVGRRVRLVEVAGERGVPLVERRPAPEGVDRAPARRR